MRNLEHFKSQEFACRCGECGLGIKNMHRGFLKRLDTAREIAGTPFIVNSSIRCPVHNAAEGGSETSSHLVGYAADIAVETSAQRFTVLKALLAVGFDRIGIGATYIHVDSDPNKPAGVVWLY